MLEAVPVYKDVDKERAVPSVWRNTFSEIVEAFKEGDYCLQRGVAGVRPIPVASALTIAGNIKAYGGRLASLRDETWQTSACQWMEGYWDVLVDLFTVEEGVVDLALLVRVYEESLAYDFEVQSVYVP